MKFKVYKSVSFLVISLFITFFLRPDRGSDFDPFLNIILTIIIIANVIAFLYQLRRIYPSWIRYDTLFILGYLIVHFQIPFLFAAFGLEPHRPHLVWPDKSVVNFATWFSAMALLFWLLGFKTYMTRNKLNKYYKFKNKYYIKNNALKFLLILFFILFLILVGEDFLRGSYSGTRNWGAGSTYIFSFLQYFLFLNIFYFFKKNEKRLTNTIGLVSSVKENIVLVSITIAYILVFLLAGDRGPVLQTGLIIAGSYSIFQKRIKLRSFIFYATFGAVLFFIISYGRTRDASSRDGNIITQGIENVQESSRHSNPTEELARSVRILYQAVDVVPDKHPHLYGLTLAFNLVDILPFGGSIYINTTNIPMMYTSSSYFFTVLKKGENFKSGEGSQIIADLYINIGVWPTLVVFLLFGYIISLFTYKAFYSKGHYDVIIYLILITTSIYVNRATFLTPLKAIIWTLLIDKIFTKKIYK